ncbi:MAG: hypothetical protein JOY82_28340 [Streptosporangiaceae bacterium]|nr:hypothetical protein [Streptosporangiaceae bacterium]MBV9858395.1 hypothetical protein [Streptosporangiaceae bacterium]
MGQEGRPSQPGGFYNTGVNISGNSGSNIAFGAGAQVTVTQNQTAADALARIDRLLAELEEAAARQLGPAPAGDALDEIELVRAEVHQRRPKTDSIRLTLGRLAAAVGSAAGLLAKVDEVKELVTLLVH